MAARAARKKLQELERKRLQALAQEASSEEEEERTATRKPTGNAFSAFLLPDEGDEEEEEEQTTTKEKDENERQNAAVQDMTKFLVEIDLEKEKLRQGSSSHKQAKNNAKKNKKKNRKGRGDEDSTETAENVEKSLAYIYGEDEGRKSGKSASSSQAQTTESPFQKKPLTLASVLETRPQDLNAETELKRLFGKRVVSGVEGERRAESRRRTPQRRGVSQLRHPHLATHLQREKCRMFVTPKEDFFVAKGAGLEMEIVDTKGDATYFAYIPKHEYLGAQRQFELCVESFSPDNLVSLSQTQPFHVDTLLQLAELYLRTDNAAQAFTVLERVLFLLEVSFHPAFKPWDGTGRSRMRISDGVNSSFFHALWRYLHMISRRGSVRTAYNIAKVLLALDPTGDPMGVRLCLDYYGIRSKAYKQIANFVEAIGASSERNILFYLPNLLFSRALALFYARQEEGGADSSSEAASSAVTDRDLSPLPDSVVGDLLSTSPEGQLRRAMLLFPATAAVLMQEIGCPASSLPFFATAAHGELALERTTKFFLTRSSGLFKATEILNWIDVVAKGVNDEVYSEPMSPVAKVFEEHRRGYGKSDHYASLYKHVPLADLSDNLETLPEEDRMPVGMRAPNQQRSGGQPLNLNQDALWVFLESMLPWNSLSAALSPEQQEEALENAVAAMTADQEEEDGEGQDVRNDDVLE